MNYPGVAGLVGRWEEYSRFEEAITWSLSTSSTTTGPSTRP